MNTSDRTPPSSRTMFWLAILCGVCLPSLTRADQMSGAYDPFHWSANKQFRLFVLEQHGQHPLLMLEQKTKKDFALRWKIKSPQGGLPARVHITDDGQYVVLEDEWGESGRGVILAFLQSKGRVLATYRLEDLFTEDERIEMIDTVSNTFWQIQTMLFLRPPQRQFVFINKSGSVRLFDLNTGKPLAVSPALAQQIRDEKIPAARKALHSANANDRATGSEQVGLLNDRASIPDLVRLLSDRTTEYHEYPVQWQAGMALVHLMGPDAVPYLAKRIDDHEGYERRRWAWLIAKAGGPKARAFLTDYGKRTHHDIGDQAITELIQHDDGSFTRANLHLLSTGSDYVRRVMLQALAEHPRKEDAPLFRKSLKNDKDLNALFALRGLIRLQPAGLDADLKKIVARKRDTFLVAEAQQELARRGDQAAISQKLAKVTALGNHRKKDHGPYGCLMPTLDAVLQILVERRSPGLALALASASKSDCETARVSVFGAMAALGDRNALTYVRAEAARPPQKGSGIERSLQVLRRSSAILWLGIAHDRESLPLIRSATMDAEKRIRETAAKALAKLGP